ncbi:MAG: hypothetical protein OEU09_21305, partial [Rhodospirillales bacterium]|nr:hypothetical protein [Rhodospirillales bacterium]
LGYRTSFDIPDLLAEGGDDGVDRLYRPSQALSCQPVTIADLRKLAMDVDGVKNAWVELVEHPAVPLHFHPGKNQLSLEEEPPASEPVYLKGLYRVLIEKSELADIDGEDVRRSVTARLHANRGLCEDFEEIRLLDSQDVKVDARVEIGQVEDADAVLLGIYEKISDYLSPTVPFRTLTQMLDEGKPIDEIFEGPVLRHGFIDTAVLDRLHRRVAVHASDLIREIMSVDGVRAVRSISLESGSKVSDWVLELAPDMTPTLDLVNTSITLQRDQLEVSANLAKVVEAYIDRQRRSRVFRELVESQRDVMPPKGRDRRLARYRSVQHQFPLVYGIGAAGLPASASRTRRAQARQLKTYVMFFDQLLANLFAQLAHAKDLLSFHGQDSRTYFSGMIDDPELDLESIRVQDADAHRESLQAITEDSAQSGETDNRRNRFLNHLLARFAEHFTDYSLMLDGARPTHWVSPAEKLIQDKQAFLQHYPRVSSGRGTAFDYTQPAGRDNVSGLEERIRLKLGLVETEEETFFLVEHILLRAMATDAEQGVPFLAATRSKDPYSLQLSLVFPNWPARFRNAGFRLLVEQTIREETPAHLAPYVYWLGPDEMTKFRDIYEDWLEKLRRLRIT